MQIIHISDLHLIAPGNTGAWLAWLFSRLHYVLHYYTFADRMVKKELPDELTRIAASQPTVLALTGDIVAWPGELQNDIDPGHYQYIESLRNALPGAVILPVLGNHDWGDSVARMSFTRPFNHVTNFENTQFQTNPDYNIIDPRVCSIQSDSVTVVFFLIDSNQEMIPATGEVSPQTISFLQQKFQDGHSGNLRGLSQQEYEQAVKIMLLHHSPLSQDAYDGALSPRLYRKLKLNNVQGLLQVCRDDIDIFLCGHTHVCTKQPRSGFTVIDAGTTLATTSVAQPSALTLNLLRIPDQDTIEVESFFLTPHGTFSSHGSKAVIFKRGQAPLGKGRWA